jgi:hypothetical protein
MELPVRMWYKGFFIFGTGGGIVAEGKFLLSDHTTCIIRSEGPIHDEALHDVMEFIDNAVIQLESMGFRAEEDDK